MASTKIGIKFKTQWWQDPKAMRGATIMGGQLNNDVLIRCCIYPSYRLNCEGAPGILLVSYFGRRTHFRLGSSRRALRKIERSSCA